MKILEFEWTEIREFLQVWEEIQRPSRERLQDLFPGSPFALENFGRDAARLVESGIIKPYTDGVRAAVSERARSFLALQRLLRRAPILAQPQRATLKTYLSELLREDERRALMPVRSYGRAEEALLDLLTDAGHVRSFVEAPSAVAWESHVAVNVRPDYGRPLEPGRRYFGAAGVAACAREIANELMLRTDPLSLLECWDARSALPAPVVAQAMAGLVRYGVALIAERSEDGAIVLTLWPPVRERLHRAPARAPEALSPSGTKSSAFAIEDLEVLLVEVAREPLRVRVNDGVPVERRAREISARFGSQPAWIEQFHAQRIGGDRLRLAFAVENALDLGWIRIEKQGEHPAHQLLPSGRAWLSLSSDERHRAVADVLRSIPDREGRSKPSAPVLAARMLGEDDDLDGEADGEADDVRFLYADRPAPRRLTLVPIGLDVLDWRRDRTRSALIEAFEDLESGVFVDLGTFVRHRAEARNPIHGTTSYGQRVGDATAEAVWSEALVLFLHMRLVPFGAAEIAEHGAPPRAAFALTRRAPYLFRATDAWPVAANASGTPRVVVQPNFEIVVSGTAPGIEARIAAFAERSHATGRTTFRLTRDSVSVAVSAGVDVDGMLATLAEVSLSPIPRNVEREVRGWAHESRTLTIEPVQIVRCPDEDTALRVIAAMGGTARLLAPTVVELTRADRLSALVRKARSAGLHLRSDTSGDGSPQTGRGGRRSRSRG